MTLGFSNEHSRQDLLMMLTFSHPGEHTAETPTQSVCMVNCDLYEGQHWPVLNLQREWGKKWLN